MLLAIDIGNSNISVGLFDQKRDLKFLSSIDTDSRKTADQISIDLMNIFSLYQYDLRDVSGAIFSSVVPPINFMMAKALTRLLGKPPMIVGPGVKTGLNIRMEIHNQLGADLVAGAVAALDKYPTPIIMIDMGTATTISYISSRRSYEGGLMFPGVRLSLDALSDHTAQLPDISEVPDGAGKAVHDGLCLRVRMPVTVSMFMLMGVSVDVTVAMVVIIQLPGIMLLGESVYVLVCHSLSSFIKDTPKACPWLFYVFYMKRRRKSSPGARTVGAVLHGGVYLLKYAVVIRLRLAVCRRCGVLGGRLDSRGEVAQRGIEAPAVKSLVNIGKPAVGVGSEEDNIARDGPDPADIR